MTKHHHHVNDEGVELQLNVIVFDDAKRAEQFLLGVAELAHDDRVSLVDAVFVHKGDDGKPRVPETGSLTPKHEAVAGGLAGLVVGTIFLGPAGGAAAGAVTAGIGAVMGRLSGREIDKAVIDHVETELEPGRTALVLLTAGGDREAMSAFAAEYAPAQLVYSDMDPEFVEAARAALRGSASPGDSGAE